MNVEILSLYFIYFLDLMGLVFVYVVLSPLIVNSSSMLPASTSLTARNVIVGFLFATPILGDLSDRFGRHIILLLSSFGTVLINGITPPFHQPFYLRSLCRKPHCCSSNGFRVCS